MSEASTTQSEVDAALRAGNERNVKELETSKALSNNWSALGEKLEALTRRIEASIKQGEEEMTKLRDNEKLSREWFANSTAADHGDALWMSGWAYTKHRDDVASLKDAMPVVSSMSNAYSWSETGDTEDFNTIWQKNAGRFVYDWEPSFPYRHVQRAFWEIEWMLRGASVSASSTTVSTEP